MATSAAIAASLLILAGCGGLSGKATPADSVSVANGNLTFGNVAVGSSATLADSISNNTSSSVTVSSITGLASGFQVTGVTLPLALAAGQTAPFNVKFHAAAAGAPLVTIAFVDQNDQTIVSVSVSADAVATGALSLNPSQVDFGSLAVGASQNNTVTLSNSGGSDLSINDATLSGAGFALGTLALPLTLHPGDSTSSTITFAPPGSGNFTGSVSFATTSEQVNGTAVLNLTGTGTVGSQGTLSPSPASLGFGSVQVGSDGDLSETLTNTGGSTVSISQANVSEAAFSVTGLNLPLSLKTNESVTFTVTFTPTSSAAASGSLSVASNASNSPLTIALSGTGTAAGQLAVSPASLSFGNVAVGSSSALSGSLTARGASVKVTSATLNHGEFAVSGISLPTTIAAGHSASFTVTFTPQSSGATSASLSFSSDASNSPAAQTMTGTGTAPVQQSVSLGWSASGDAVGYNIYRGTVSGGPYAMMNSSLDSTTTYTDSTVASGQTYYYVTTAVNASGAESGYSNQAKAVVPN